MVWVQVEPFTLLTIRCKGFLVESFEGKTSQNAHFVEGWKQLTRTNVRLLKVENHNRTEKSVLCLKSCQFSGANTTNNNVYCYLATSGGFSNYFSGKRGHSDNLHKALDGSNKPQCSQTQPTVTL